MPTTNYPNGLTSMGIPTFGPGGQNGNYNGVPYGAQSVPLTNGNYFFVDSVTGSAGFPGTASSPLATLAGALALCTANNGDVIVLCPGHAETISTAGGININVAGVTVVGIGAGRNRPVFTFATSTAATMLLSAAGVSLLNVVGTTTVDQIVSPWVVSAADVEMSVEWQDGSNVLEALRAVLTTSGASRLRLNILYNGFTNGSHGVNAVRLVGGTGAQVNVNYYGVLTTAVVEFATTAVVDCQVTGWMYVSGITNFSRTVVDTITGSTWSVQGFDGAAALSFGGGSGKAIAGNDPATIVADLGVPTADSTANTLERDVIGNKTDAVLTATGTTKSVLAYVKTALANVGFLADSSVYVPGNTNSIMSYLKGNADLQEGAVSTSAATLTLTGTPGVTVFTIAGGPIEILSLTTIVATVAQAVATTVQWQNNATLGATAWQISGTSASLSGIAAGSAITLQPTALSTAPAIVLAGASTGVSATTAIKILAMAGNLAIIVGTSSNTGTFQHFLRYRPLAKGVTVTAAF